MVKSYMRHGPTEAFGLVCSASSNSLWDGTLAYVPALEDVLVWNIRTGEMFAMWHETGHRAEVTCIERSPEKDIFAVGYADGSVRLWNATSGAVVATFNGHKKAVTVLAFDAAGARLASGSQDTELIIWDVFGEAGLYRLRGHRDQITAISFVYPHFDEPSTSSTTDSPGFVLSSSKDTLIKLWDLSTQHCVQTIVAHSSEVWSLDVNKEQDLVLSGGGDGELKAWRIDHVALAEGLKESETGEIKKMLHFVSTISLSSRHRVSQLLFHPSRPYLAVQSHDRSIEVFRIRTEDEIKKKQARRRRREREKIKSKGADSKSEPKEGNINEQAGQNAKDVDDDKPIDLVDIFTPYLVVRASGKVRSFAFVSEDSDTTGTQIFIATASNALEIYKIPTPTKSKDLQPEAKRTRSFDRPGHRTDVRTLCLSSDDELLASASNGSLKIWNVRSTACIRTMDCEYAICSTFLPGNAQIAIGTKGGEILLYDLASSSLLETIQAHSGPLWSMHVRPDGRALVSGGADKDVKFWELAPKDGQAIGKYSTPSNFSLQHVRTLKMADDVLSVRYSTNEKLLAVSLLDSTVKVFYADSLKFFLSLYGHKLPVLSMDISDDSKLLVTCSADKNVKIWGLDFGDCHKSIFAHDESIMQVAFEKKSHYFWTVGKDSLVKYWDGDKFENIQKLEGHHAEVWALAVSHYGNFVVTASHDKSIRVWTKLDEPLFLEEEREREMEQLYEHGIAESLDRSDAAIGSGAPGNEGTSAEMSAEAIAVSKQTADTLMAGERIMEALDLADAERAASAEFEIVKGNVSPEEAAKLPPLPKNPVLAAYKVGPEEYVLMVLEKIQRTALTDALLVLPFGKVVSLVTYLDEFAQRGWNVELTAQVTFFLLRTHHNQVVAQQTLKTTLISLQRNIRMQLQGYKDIMGYNLAALRHIQRMTENRQTVVTFDEQRIDGEYINLNSLKERDATDDKKRKRTSMKN